MAVKKLQLFCGQTEFLNLCTSKTTELFFPFTPLWTGKLFDSPVHPAPPERKKPVHSVVFHLAYEKEHHICEMELKSIEEATIKLERKLWPVAKVRKMYKIVIGNIIPEEESIDPHLDYQGLRINNKKMNPVMANWMKIMQLRNTRKVVPLLLLCFNLHAQCPTQGKTKYPPLQVLNRLKNRSVSTSRQPQIIALSSILAPGNDEYRFSDSSYSTVTGYVCGYAFGGPETCNCNSKFTHDHDIHVYISTIKGAPQKQCMVCELTPQSKTALGINESNIATYVGKVVTITGYMLFDWVHIHNAQNTNNGSKAYIWRQTAWEIHPICKMHL